MFNDFLIDYRIEKEKIYNSHRISQLPKIQKIFIVLIFLFAVITYFFIFGGKKLAMYLSCTVFILLYILLCCTIHLPKAQKALRENFYSNYDQKIIIILKKLLKKYNIDSDKKLEFIINQAQKKCQKAGINFYINLIVSISSPFIATILTAILQPTPNVLYLFLFLLLFVYFFLNYLLCKYALDMFVVNKSLYEEIIQGLEYIRAFDSGHDHT